MKLKLVRDTFTHKSTEGKLYIEDEFECFTLEDVVREGPKVAHYTAIPYGTYEIAITFSNRFKRPLPLLMSVPDFTGIRIHPGNSDVDTDGCILVGKEKQTNFVGRSREAFSLLFTKIQSALAYGKVTIEIVKGEVIT